MCIYIEISDLVANALINLGKENETNKKISLPTLLKYGGVIVKHLGELGQDAILCLTRESTYEFIQDYADYFSFTEYDGIQYIELAGGVSVVELRKQFRKNLTVDFARVANCKELISVIRNRALTLRV